MIVEAKKYLIQEDEMEENRTFKRQKLDIVESQSLMIEESRIIKAYKQQQLGIVESQGP